MLQVVRIRTWVFVFLLIFFLLQSCSSNGGEYVEIKKEADGMVMKEISETEREILKTGLRASSSHNSQPWKIINNGEGRYILMTVEERSLPEVDPDRRELFLSLGALIENLKQSARAHGWEMDFTLKSADRDALVVGDFILVDKGGRVDSVRLEDIREAYTEKGKYKQDPFNPGMIEELFRGIDSREHVRYISRGTDLFEVIRGGTIEANRKQSGRDNVQRELAEYICYSTEDEERGIGMSPSMMRLPGFMRFFWYRTASEKTVTSQSFRNGTVSKVRGQIKNSSGFIVLTSRDDSVSGLLECGGLYQRLLIEAGRIGIGIQPMSQILEEAPWKDELRESGVFAYSVQFILRTGFLRGGRSDQPVDEIASVSIRMPFSDAVENGY